MRYIEPLTNREIECLYHAAQDKNARETAEQLCISLETVKTHRRVILRKLRCKTMVGALARALKFGFLFDDSEK